MTTKYTVQVKEKGPTFKGMEISRFIGHHDPRIIMKDKAGNMVPIDSVLWMTAES